MNISYSIALLTAISAVSFLGASTAQAAGPVAFKNTRATELSSHPFAQKKVKPIEGELNASALEAEPESIVITLPGVGPVNFLRDKVDRLNKNSFTWLGRAEDGEGNASLTVYKKSVAGHVVLNGELYEIKTAHSRKKDKNSTVNLVNPGVAEVTLMDIRKFPVDDVKVPPGSEKYKFAAEPIGGGATIGADSSTGSSGSSSGGTPPAGGDNIVQDVMVVYTTAICNAYGRDADGGCSSLEASIINAVANANLAYQNSQVNITMNLVKMMESPYAETGDMYKSLEDITYGAGVLSAVHEVRNQVAADLVSFMTNESGYCGIGWYLGGEAYGFSIVKPACMSMMTFAHEIGHNQGLDHNRGNDNAAGAYPYSYGHRHCVSGGFRSVMSYDCGVPRIPYFSNPNVFYDGLPTGVSYELNPANSAENARTLNNTASIIANYRTLPGDVPGAPSNLQGNAPAYDRVSLTWRDNATNENGFNLQRSLDGLTWSQIATLGSNTTNYLNTGLTGSTTYYYRLNAFNSVGTSSYSNIATVTTPLQQSAVVSLATSETPESGVVSGIYTDTHADDGNTLESITEVSSGGNRPYNYLSHIWNFSLPAGFTTRTFYVNAYILADGADADRFTLSYSVNGGRWKTLTTVTSTNPNNLQSVTLPSNVSGNVRVRVVDTNRKGGQDPLRNSFVVDHMYFRSQ